MKADHLAQWIEFLASPAAPATAMRPLELEGYLTGLAVAPELIMPSVWLDDLWGEDDPIFEDMEQANLVFGTVMALYNAAIERVDREGNAFRPMYFDESGVADLLKAEIWVRGFWKAMMLSPDAWNALADREETEILVEPFAVFIVPTAQSGVAPAAIEQMRRNSAELIPSIIHPLRRLAQIRASRQPVARPHVAKAKRNDPCPCGSGKKYKKCCALD